MHSELPPEQRCWLDGADAELNRFCSIALGSASELQYFLLLAKDLRLLAEHGYRLAEKTTEVKRRVTGLAQKLKAPANQNFK